MSRAAAHYEVRIKLIKQRPLQTLDIEKPQATQSRNAESQLPTLIAWHRIVFRSGDEAAMLQSGMVDIKDQV